MPWRTAWHKAVVMSSLAETIAFVFGLVALGYASGWSGLLKTETGDALTQFAVSIALPVLLFRTMSGADFASGLPLALWFCYFAAIAATWAVGQVVTMRVFKRDARAGVIGGLSASFSNLVLLGLPFILGTYGHEGVETLSLIISVHLPTMICVSVILFALLGGGEGRDATPAGVARDICRELFANPLIIGILAGVAWRLTGLDMPSLGARFIDTFADVAGPIALFAMGLGLRRFGISGNVRPALMATVLKLFFMPAMALLMVKLVGLPSLDAKVAVAAASMASGVNPYLIASRFGTGQALSSNAMTISTACAALSTALWLLIAHWAFP